MDTLSPSPYSDAACSADIDRLGSIERALKRIETTKAELIAAATKTIEEEATALLAEKTTLETRIAEWCAKERDRLTGNYSTKTVAFSAGTVAWRLGKPSIEFDDAIVATKLARFKKSAIAAILDLAWWGRFTSVKIDLSKQKIAGGTGDERVKLRKWLGQGIRFLPGEESFSIVPAGTADELADRPPAEAAE